MISLVLLALFIFAAPTQGQHDTPASGQAMPVPVPENTIKAEDQEHAIKVRINEVLVPVTVVNSKGERIFDLPKNDFHIFDNDVEQTIESLDLGGDALSVVLVFETSSRVSILLHFVQKSGSVFTQTLIGPSGEAAILSYSDSVERLSPFTADHQQIEKTIANLKVGSSGTRPYDAISAAVRLLRDRPISRRRVVIVVGEGRDTGSDARLGEVLREALLANVVIYTVGISTTATVLGSAWRGKGGIDLVPVAEWAVRNAKAVVKGRPLELATAGTGGLYQSTFRGRTIENAVDAIGDELNSQYALTYRPAYSEAPGYHKIKIVVDRPGTKIRTRPGYYLGSE
jgi:VWFA-related protein